MCCIGQRADPVSGICNLAKSCGAFSQMHPELLSMHSCAPLCSLYHPPPRDKAFQTRIILKTVARIAARNRVDGLLNFLHQTRINFQNPSATPPSPNLLAMSLRAAFAQGPVRLHLRLGRSNRNRVAAERP